MKQPVDLSGCAEQYARTLNYHLRRSVHVVVQSENKDAVCFQFLKFVISLGTAYARIIRIPLRSIFGVGLIVG